VTSVGKQLRGHRALLTGLISFCWRICDGMSAVRASRECELYLSEGALSCVRIILRQVSWLWLIMRLLRDNVFVRPKKFPAKTELAKS